MRNMLILLTAGIAIGYFIGFSDARSHERDIVHRLVERAGGKSRAHMPNDIDAAMERVEKK